MINSIGISRKVLQLRLEYAIEVVLDSERNTPGDSPADDFFRSQLVIERRYVSATIRITEIDKNE